jgi:hypothetical protein
MDVMSEDELCRYVHEFLENFKALVLEHGLLVTDRVVNRDQLIELGLTGRQREEMILSLSVANFSEGPIRDQYRPGNLWVFGVRLERTEIYIKLKIGGSAPDERAVCISFHKAEHPLNYPFAER